MGRRLHTVESLEKLFLERLDKRIAKTAVDGATNPSDKTEFGFGKLNGKVLGLTLAKEIFLSVAYDEDEDDESSSAR